MSTNVLSVLILHHHLNGLGNNNIRSIQEVMRASEPSSKKYKRVCEDFPNLAILTKISTPGEVHLMYGQSDVGNKSLGESVEDFALAGDIRSPTVIILNIDNIFSADGDKIRLPIAEVLFCATVSNLARSKKQWDWMLCNAVILPPFLMESEILHRELNTGELLKIFA